MLAVGRVTPRAARIWSCATGAQAGGYEIEWHPVDGPDQRRVVPIDLARERRDFTGSVEITDGLAPGRAYRVTLRHPGSPPLASGRFTTAPDPNDPPRRLAIGLMSCHQPFTATGKLTDASEAMLEAAHRAFQAHDVYQVILAGDQLYADHPWKLSLFERSHFERVAPPGRDAILECTEHEVRRLFHQRYRHFWSLEGWQRLLSSYSCCPIADDHDIVDNWGSAVEHQDEAWQAYLRGAMLAYHDYQHSLVCDPADQLPDDLDYQLDLADTATYVMDLRSNRRVGEDPRVVSDSQIGKLLQFLRTQRDRQVVFLVLSVPLIHLPHYAAGLLARVPPDGEDFSDRWSTRGQKHDRDRILRLLRRHQEAEPHQRIVLLSGDIHIGCLHRIRWQDRQPNLFQFISSGITNDVGAVVQALSSLLMRSKRRIRIEGEAEADLELIPGMRGRSNNPCGRLNFGIVELTREHPEDAPSMRFLLYSHKGDQPLLRYSSPPFAPTAARRD